MVPQPSSSPEIPVLDFGLFRNGTDQEKKIVASGIDDAFRNYGFVYLTNHGVPQEQLDEAFKWNKKFFDLPTEVKNLAPHPPGGSHHRGYSGLGVEKVSQFEFDEEAIAKLREVPDVKESYESGNENDPDQPNIWLPDEHLRGFRDFMQVFFKDLEQLLHTILKALDLSLSLPLDHFTTTHSRSLFQLRLLHYPPIPVSALRHKAVTRISAHSDFGTLTLLFQDAVGGLEIQHGIDPATSEPVFIRLGPVPGAVIVNVGDLMTRWSNGRWKSAVHRVTEPDNISNDGETCPSRYSIPFFATANPDSVIECLPGCEGPNGEKLYDPVTAWGYVQMRMAALYS